MFHSVLVTLVSDLDNMVFHSVFTLELLEFNQM